MSGTSADIETLLPCPFCRAAQDIDQDICDTGVFWVRCSECCAESNAGDTREEAAEKWNTRAQPAGLAQGSGARDLPLIWKGWANALRLMDSKRSEPDPAAQAQADAYDQCATELREALGGRTPAATAQGSPWPFQNALEKTLRVMKSAHANGGGRLMSIWEDDIQAVEEALAALTANRTPAETVEPAAWHCPACEATVVVDDSATVEPDKAVIEQMRADLARYATANTNLRNDLVQRGMAHESELAQLRDQVECLRGALGDLYKECAAHNDFRPDSKCMREARQAYIRNAPANSSTVPPASPLPSCGRAGGNCECTSIEECPRAFAQLNQE